MYQKQFNNQAESVVVSYILAIGLFTILSALLIATAGGYLETKQNSVTEIQAEITVEAIASEIEEVDKHARKINDTSASAGYITYQSQTDKLIGQYPYKVRLLSNPQPDTYTVEVSVQTNKVDVRETTNVTLIEIDDAETGSVVSGSTLAVKYTRGGKLQLVEESTKYAINQTSAYYIPTDAIISTGGIKSQGDVRDGDNAIVYGDINSDSEVELDDDVTIVGNITSRLETRIGERSSVTGDITAQEAQVLVRENSTIGGNIEASGDIEIRQQSIVNGDLASSGTVSIGADSIIQNDVKVSNGFNLYCGTNVTINGKDCATYKNDNY